MKTTVVGASHSLLLASSNDTRDTRGVVLDMEQNSVVRVDDLSSLLGQSQWSHDIPVPEVPKELLELARAALTRLDIEQEETVLAAGGRMYTIPKSVQREAEKGLKWRKKYKRGGTPVGLNTARTLAGGGQVGLKKVAHIARYFPRHEIDKRASGWKPGNAKFPSNGRIAWALWGGDAGRRWASAIVKREKKQLKTLLGDAYALWSADDPAVDPDLDAFDDDRESFYALIVHGTGNLARLYRLAPNGGVYTWDSGSWYHPIDAGEDEPDFTDERTYVELDAEAALKLAGWLDVNPEEPCNPYKLASNDEEREVVEQGVPRLDFGMLESMFADMSVFKPISLAGEAAPMLPAAPTPEDDGYTPEERAKNAGKQARDARGRFLKTGSKGFHKTGGWELRVEGTNPQNGNAIVRSTKNGQLYEVDSKDVEQVPDDSPSPAAPAPESRGALPPPMASEDVKKIVRGYEKQIAAQRDDRPPAPAEFAEPDPEASDVKPVYLAIVDREDPQAVLQLVALAPATQEGSKAMAFIREDETWKPDAKVLADLVGPTPPPTVVLDDALLADVLAQVDGTNLGDGEKSAASHSEEQSGSPGKNPGELYSTVVKNSLEYSLLPQVGSSGEIVLVAAGVPGIADTPSDYRAVQRLKRYWKFGKGALKIRWNTPGDWTRCYRHLKKYMGVRAKGYCANLHKEMTGVWPGDKRNIGKK